MPDISIDMAEGAGFEPALGYSPKHAFQACDLNHSSTLPMRLSKTRRIIKHIPPKILINAASAIKVILRKVIL